MQLANCKLLINLVSAMLTMLSHQHRDDGDDGGIRLIYLVPWNRGLKSVKHQETVSNTRKQCETVTDTETFGFQL